VGCRFGVNEAPVSIKKCSDRLLVFSCRKNTGKIKDYFYNINCLYSDLQAVGLGFTKYLGCWDVLTKYLVLIFTNETLIPNIWYWLLQSDVNIDWESCSRGEEDTLSLFRLRVNTHFNYWHRCSTLILQLGKI